MTSPSPTPSSPMAPVPLEEARRIRRRNLFIDKWIRRTLRRYRVTPAQLEELRAAGQVGALQGEQDWQALPESERTEDKRRAFVATGIRDEVWAAWDAMNRGKGKRAQALAAASHATLDSDELSFQERLRNIRAHVNHETYAGLLHGSLGLGSPEDAYLAREQEKLARDRVQFAFARLESEQHRVLAQKLLVEKLSLREACAAIGIHEKSARTRARRQLFALLREHASDFASSLAARHPPNDDGDGTPT